MSAAPSPTADGRPLRVLFLHAALDYNPEYEVHRLLAAHADPQVLTSLFVEQSSSAARSAEPSPGRLLWDFGRDQTLDPRPSRAVRALMMAGRLPGALLLLRRVLRDFAPDVVYTSQQRYDLRLVALLRPLARFRQEVHLHYLVQPSLGRHAVRTLLRARRVITVSEFLRRQAVGAGLRADRVQTLLNPAELDRFDLPRRPGEWQGVLPLPEGTPVVVAAGRLDPSKGHLLLLEAFALLRRELPAARLVVCGITRTRDGHDEVLRARCAELGLTDAVLFAGQRHDLPEIYARAEVFCLPTVDDPCPLVFLEAMAAGLPAVGLRSGGVPEIVGDAGLLVEPGDPAGLAAALRALLTDAEERRRRGDAGRCRATALFEPRAVSARWVDLLLDPAHQAATPDRAA